jgi:hypothetical protein
MNYKETLNKLGFTLEWEEASGSGPNILQYTNGEILIQVAERGDGYHKFSACPKKCFDRWANSRHINWKLMVENYNQEHGFGWSEEKVQSDLERNVNDTIFLCNTLPERMFDRFINIDL